MKKITFFILTIFTVATLFAAARPSLDGRAVVADSGTMPRGLFARTVGYLPGDSVTVTNPATGSTVDVLVLGAIDPSEGVAILLSPEAAEGLRIRPDSNVQVKLTKRSGSLDENANGSAVLSDGNDVEEVPAIAEKSAVEEKKESAPANVAESAGEKAGEEVASLPENTEKPDYEEYPAVAENLAPPVETPAELLVESPVETPAEAPVETALETPVEIVETVPLVAAVENEKTELATVYEEVPPLPEEKLEKVTEDSLGVSVEEPLQKVVVIETEAPAEKADESQEKLTEEKVSEVEEVVAVNNEEPAVEKEPEVIAENIEENTDEYQPIILIPTDMNPPVAENSEEPVKAENPEESLLEEEKIALTAPESEPAEEKPVTISPVSNDWTNYVVPSFKNLRSGSYYVQVASLGKTENIKSFVDKYSAKYPVVLVQNAAKTSYQVMVGPLNIDEYGSIDEKFKAYGFKDAFIRKIK